jgi:hypothetical protein
MSTAQKLLVGDLHQFSTHLPGRGNGGPQNRHLQPGQPNGEIQGELGVQGDRSPLDHRVPAQVANTSGQLFPDGRRLRHREHRGSSGDPIPRRRGQAGSVGRRDLHVVSSLTRTRAGGKNYSFKCHRYDVPTGSMPGTPAQTFHKAEGTFCTGGSDGSITFWDGVARTKLKGGSMPVGSS